MVLITAAPRGTRANRVGIKKGDMLVSINSHEINDVLDYRFFLADEKITLKVIRNSSELEFTIKKDIYDDIGLEFESPLMDDKKSCLNKCIFCFIDQLPDGMRETLYFKDDDSRLSFLHGNYITLTNLKKRDIERIIEMHIEPVNISIHTTDPELRKKMMHNKNAGAVLSYLDMLYEANVRMHGQIVLCKNVNDGDKLIKTLNDLEKYYPALESVSIVPAGLTAHREGLYPLEPFTSDEAGKVIDIINSIGDKCLEKYGTRIFFPSDEFYLKAERPLPEAEYYEDFAQYENGVGMLSSFERDLVDLLAYLEPEEKQIKRNVSVATGEAAGAMITKCAKMIEEVCANVSIAVYPVKNKFFGGEVTVTGLLTGYDLTEGLKNKSLGDELILCRNMLRAEGDLFLDGMTPEKLSDLLNCEISFSAEDAESFLYTVLGIDLI